jgi:nucleoside-diphosphate-sugar epimerase
MLEHLLADAQRPSRVVVIGSAGFVGGAIVKRLARENVPCLPLGRA